MLVGNLFRYRLLGLPKGHSGSVGQVTSKSFPIVTFSKMLLTSVNAMEQADSFLEKPNVNSRLWRLGISLSQ